MACFPRPWNLLPVWLFAEAQMPERFMDTYSADQMPPAEEARPILRAMIADRLGPLREREAYLREAIEVPDRAEAPERALILKDKDEARLFLRYYGESRSTFFRAHAALVKAIKGRGEQAEALAQTVETGVDAVAEGPPSDGPEAVSRNEAKSADETAVKAEEEVTSGETEGERGPPARASEGARSRSRRRSRGRSARWRRSRGSFRCRSGASTGSRRASRRVGSGSSGAGRERSPGRVRAATAVAAGRGMIAKRGRFVRITPPGMFACPKCGVALG